MIVNGHGRVWTKNPKNGSWYSDDGHCVTSEDFRKFSAKWQTDIEQHQENRQQYLKNGGSLVDFILDDLANSRVRIAP